MVCLSVVPDDDDADGAPAWWVSADAGCGVATSPGAAVAVDIERRLR